MIVDWIQSLCIFAVFAALTIVQLFNASIKSVQENWSVNRCTPSIIPFAGYLAPKGSNITTQDNFAYCIQGIMNSFAPMIMQPFSFIQNMTVDMMGSMNESSEKSKEQSSSIKLNVSSVIGSLYAVFLGVIIEFNVLIIKLMDTQGKLSGTVATLMNVMTATQYTFQSMWNGIPGKMIQTIGKL
jgi:hypothetical protein